MTFNPSSTIWLCNVPFDNSYKNVVYFPNRNTQQAYMTARTKRPFTEYLTVRKTLPDGGLRSSVKVGMNIDALRSLPCNYMYYQNAHHGTRFFYAFITEFIYINEECTELVFETDVFQTWFLDVEMKQSFVEREHSVADEIAGNIVPENFNFQDYTYRPLTSGLALSNWGYLVALTNKVGDEGSRGRLHAGVYQGLYFYYLESANEVNSLIDQAEEDTSDSVVSITLIPKFCVSSATLNADGYVNSTTEPNVSTLTFTMDDSYYAFREPDITKTYTPKNKKLFTAPFFMLYATNNCGQQVEYKLEDFTYPNRVQFKAFADVSASPTVTYLPLNYKGSTQDPDFGISTGVFPQCGFNSDTFKLWLNKNEYGNRMSIGTGALLALAGAAVAGVFAPAGLAVAGAAGGAMGGVAMGVHGLNQINNVLNNIHQASFEPNKVNAGSQTNNLLTAIKRNTVDFFIRMVKPTYAKTIDDYFTMFGYQTNEVKIPNLSSRPYFNFVKTIDVNIVGGIPNDDMATLKNIFNNGVTLWKSNATIGDYSVDNSP